MCNYHGIETASKSNQDLLISSVIGPSRSSCSSTKFLDGCSEDSQEDSLSEDSSEEEGDEGDVVGGEALKR